MTADLAETLFEALSDVCPISGITIGDPADKNTWRIDFDLSATHAQRAAAEAALIHFDVHVATAGRDPLPATTDYPAGSGENENDGTASLA
jgi:hypothetical protein